MFLLESIYFRLGIAAGIFIAVIAIIIAKPKNALIPIVIGGIVSLLSGTAIAMGIFFALCTVQLGIGFLIGYTVIYSILYLVKYFVKGSSVRGIKGTAEKGNITSDDELDRLIEDIMRKNRDRPNSS